MRKTATRLIDGSSYELQAMDARTQMLMYPKLAPLVGPLLDLGGRVFGGDEGAAAELFTTFGERLKPEDLDKYMCDLLWSLRRDGKDISSTGREPGSTRGSKFTEAMSGETLTVWKLLAWSLEVNFGDFFDEARRWLERAKAVAAKEETASESSSPST